MNMNAKQILLALGVLITGVAFGQTTTTSATDPSSTATGTLNTPATGNSTNSVAPLNSTYSTTTRTTRDGKRNDGKGGKFGIYAGVNFSKFVNEPLPDNTYRPGYQAGLYYRSPGTVFGQIGAEYRAASSNLTSTRRGGGTTPGSVATELRDNINQRFLAIPVYVGLRVGGRLGFRVQAGGELSALVGVDENDFNLGDDDLNRTILNGLVGAGINLGPLTLDAVYNHGFRQVFDAGADTKRNMLAVNLGLRF